MSAINPRLLVEGFRPSQRRRVAYLHAADHDSSGSRSRRRSTRIYKRIAATLREEAEDRTIPSPATILDLSRHGVRVAARESFSRGQTLKLEFAYKGKTYPLRARVVWVSAELGLEFLE